MDFVISGFNYIDVGVGVLIFLLALKGFLNGLTRELFGIVGLVGGVFAASRTADTAAAYITQYVSMPNTSILKLIVFIVILLVVWMFVAFIGRLVSGPTQASFISVPNRLLGFVTAAVKYFLIFSMIVAALFKTPLIRENIGKTTVSESILYPYLDKTGSYLINMAPAGNKKSIKTKTAPAPGKKAVQPSINSAGSSS